MKECKQCKKLKQLSEYHKHSTSNDGYQTMCKICRNEKSKKYHKLNRDRINQVSKVYRESNKDKIRDLQNNYRIERKKVDSTYKLKNSIRRSINNAFSRNGYPKSSKTYEILGCSFEEFKEHLESQFKDWMSWDNYGKYNGKEYYGWDIDHIIPVSSGINENEVIQLNHFTNLQPLCSHINRDIKRDII